MLQATGQGEQQVQVFNEPAQPLSKGQRRRQRDKKRQQQEQASVAASGHQFLSRSPVHGAVFPPVLCQAAVKRALLQKHSTDSLSRLATAEEARPAGWLLRSDNPALVMSTPVRSLPLAAIPAGALQMDFRSA